MISAKDRVNYSLDFFNPAFDDDDFQEEEEERALHETSSDDEDYLLPPSEKRKKLDDLYSPETWEKIIQLADEGKPFHSIQHLYRKLTYPYEISRLV